MQHTQPLKSLIPEAIIKISDKSMRKRDFPGGPVVKALSSKAQDVGSIPGQGAKIL